MIPEIYSRRSIRKFQPAPIPQEKIEEIIRSGIKAPSAKNRQPWSFVVVQGSARAEMIKAFREGIMREEKEGTLLPGSKCHLADAKHTVSVMETAPVSVFVINPVGMGFDNALTPEDRIYEICNSQSIGAAVQNMLLTAENMGIGSLWICNTFFAYDELCKWLGCKGQLAAAVALGYPAEAPQERPRKKLEELVEWRS